MFAPAGKLAVENVAVPDERVTPPGVKSVLVVVSKKSTVPVGVPEPGALAATLAVKVTVWPKLDVLAEEVTVVVVLSCWTLSAVLMRLKAKLVSPW